MSRQSDMPDHQQGGRAPNAPQAPGAPKTHPLPAGLTQFAPAGAPAVKTNTAAVEIVAIPRNLAMNPPS